MRAIAVFLLIVGCHAVRTVAHDVPQVDQAEVLRLGDLVQPVGRGARASDVDDYVAALAPPVSDVEKWFISVVTSKGCPACEQLQRDWAKDPWLLALAMPDHSQQSWAHYNVYSREDRSQAFRFQGISITTYPTVLVQPPRSGKYGDPKTVVFQGVYGGDPRRMAEAITQTIGQYVGQLKPASTIQEGAAKAGGYDPPWSPTTKEDEPRFPDHDTVAPLDRLLQIVPPKAPVFPWSLVLTALSAGGFIPTALALLIWAIYFVRGRGQVAGKPLHVDPAKLDRLIELLQAINETPRSPQA